VRESIWKYSAQVMMATEVKHLSITRMKYNICSVRQHEVPLQQDYSWWMRASVPSQNLAYIHKSKSLVATIYQLESTT